jgi:hypothetical protein
MIKLSMVWMNPSFHIPSHSIINSCMNISSLANLLIEPTNN